METYIQTAKGLVLLAFLGVCGYFVWNYNHMTEQVGQIDPLRAQVAALERQQKTLATEVITRQQLDTAIRAARVQTVTRIESVKANDPTTRAYLDERIPDGLRNAHLGHTTGPDAVPATDGH